ncbi:hypothetical protein OSB04_014778 [Centaurea solstitialis]|uniref:PHD-type domain-containing protein n=1 Tax=Centaurea solstitialis TaxID=347529 RepID=A0AA38THM1_9ASTR|nr:hypothetical protein OSB04_014778 [Centaurea solstitialis]
MNLWQEMCIFFLLQLQIILITSPSLATCQNQKKQLPATGSNENAKCEKGEPTSEKVRQRRKRKRKNNKVEVDEASRLQRRTRYLLIKMKIEQNLLDAYSTEGWKGQSREKIKPEKELQRAKKQILKCKLGIRDVLRQLDLLSSDGCIDESVIGPDGSVHHDNIHCAKCKLRDAFPDNDIILCDGTCNCAFHQMCIDPPLLTENIPPGDQGWFCKYCICKTEIMDAINAHLGTSYPHDSNWQEIFKVEATLPDGGNTLLNQEEWPSDDSGDDDYDPYRVEKRDSSCSRVCSEGESCDDDDASSSYSLHSLDDTALEDESQKLRRNTGHESTSADLIGAVSGSGSDCDFVGGRRQRQAVDYRKLYDEMFGKDALANDQASEDEDWGPTNRKRREKESDAASTLMTLCETEEKSIKDNADTPNIDTSLSCKDTKRSSFRIPSEAVEKLRVVFAKDELPSRAVKEDLSKQLDLDLEKIYMVVIDGGGSGGGNCGVVGGDSGGVLADNGGGRGGNDSRIRSWGRWPLMVVVMTMGGCGRWWRWSCSQPTIFDMVVVVGNEVDLVVVEEVELVVNVVVEVVDGGRHWWWQQWAAGEEKPTQNDGPSISKESGSEPAKNEAIDEILAENIPTTLDHTPTNGRMRKFRRRKNPQLPTTTAKQQQVEKELNLSTSANKVGANEDLVDGDLSLKTLTENAKKEVIPAVDIGCSSEGDDQQAAAAESQMEKLCFLKTKMEKLKQVLLLRTPNRRAKTTAAPIDHSNTVFIPVAHLKEKH